MKFKMQFLKSYDRPPLKLRVFSIFEIRLILMSWSPTDIFHISFSLYTSLELWLFGVCNTRGYFFSYWTYQNLVFLESSFFFCKSSGKAHILKLIVHNVIHNKRSFPFQNFQNSHFWKDTSGWFTFSYGLNLIKLLFGEN